MRQIVPEHEELLAKIDLSFQDIPVDYGQSDAHKALRAVVELPKEFTNQMNINIVNEQDPVLIAKMFYKAGYKNAMYKVIEVIEKELNG